LSQAEEFVVLSQKRTKPWHLGVSIEIIQFLEILYKTNAFIYFSFSLLTYRFSDYYFVCAKGGQHDGHLPFWFPAFVKVIMLLLHVSLLAEINILLLICQLSTSNLPKGNYRVTR